MLERDATDLMLFLERLVVACERIADRLDPPPPGIVDSPCVASRLGCTTTWVADMARRGEIPVGCVVPGTGNGRPWKFYRAKVETWIALR
jgi:hypothetical protein